MASKETRLTLAPIRVGEVRSVGPMPLAGDRRVAAEPVVVVRADLGKYLPNVVVFDSTGDVTRCPT